MTISPEKLRSLLDHAGDAVVVTDSNGSVQFWNLEATRLLGYERDEIVGKYLASLTKDRGKVSDSIFESSLLHKAGQEIWVERSESQVNLDGSLWTLHIFRCAENRRRRIEELEREASTDSMSGLCNRREFQRKLESNLDKALTLAILDIDNFKEINDQFGHWVGDEAIQFVARNLTDLFPKAVCIARLGGDEFGVVLECDSIAEAESEFEGFQRASTERANEAHLKAIPKVSIGVAFSSGPGVSARELLTLADQQMYQAKSGGRNRTCVAAI